MNEAKEKVPSSTQGLSKDKDLMEESKENYPSKTEGNDKEESHLGKDVGIGAAALGGTGAVGAGAAALAHGKKDNEEDTSTP